MNNNKNLIECIRHNKAHSVANEEYESDLNKLKKSVLNLRKAEDEASNLRTLSRKIADEFICKYSNDKPMLGKIATCLLDYIGKDEFFGNLANSIGPLD